eukprot:6209165-Pleurochrysis_carterae.AAC.3
MRGRARATDEAYLLASAQTCMRLRAHSFDTSAGSGLHVTSTAYSTYSASAQVLRLLARASLLG